MSTATTSAPAAAKAKADASPMPCPAPVTNAIRSANGIRHPLAVVSRAPRKRLALGSGVRQNGGRRPPSQPLPEKIAMGQYSKAETEGHLLIVTIDRPEVMNALHPMPNQELCDIFDEFAANPELWVAIITGAGDKAFSAGNDLKYHAELRAKTGGRPPQRGRHGRGLRDRAGLRPHHRLRSGTVRAARAARGARRRRQRHAAPV